MHGGSERSAAPVIVRLDLQHMVEQAGTQNTQDHHCEISLYVLTRSRGTAELPAQIKTETDRGIRSFSAS